MESLTNCSLSRFSPHVNNTSTPILLGADKKTLKDVSLSANGTPNTAKEGDNAESKFSDSLRSRDELFRGSSPLKRKLDRNSSSSKKGRFEFDLESGEHLTTITQLREEIECFRKQLNNKDQVIFQKEQKITELKAQLFELDKETRLRISQVQKQNDEIIDSLQTKIRELQKIVNSTASRNPKKATK